MFFFYKNIIIFNSVSVPRDVHVPSKPRVVGSPEAGATDDVNSPNREAGN